MQSRKCWMCLACSLSLALSVELFAQNANPLNADPFFDREADIGERKRAQAWRDRDAYLAQVDDPLSQEERVQRLAAPPRSFFHIFELGFGYTATYPEEPYAVPQDDNYSMTFGWRLTGVDKFFYSTLLRINWNHVAVPTSSYMEDLIDAEIGAIGGGVYLTHSYNEWRAMRPGDRFVNNNNFFTTLDINIADFRFGGNGDPDEYGENTYWQYAIPVHLQMFWLTPREQALGIYVEAAYVLTGNLSGDTSIYSSGFEVTGGFSLGL